MCKGCANQIHLAPHHSHWMLMIYVPLELTLKCSQSKFMLNTILFQVRSVIPVRFGSTIYCGSAGVVINSENWGLWLRWSVPDHFDDGIKFDCVRCSFWIVDVFQGLCCGSANGRVCWMPLMKTGVRMWHHRWPTSFLSSRINSIFVACGYPEGWALRTSNVAITQSWCFHRADI